MSQVEEFILEYLQREYTFPDDADVMNINYIEERYVDSLAFVQFISIIEDEFNIVFSDDELENPDIMIVGNLIELIENKVNM